MGKRCLTLLLGLAAMLVPSVVQAQSPASAVEVDGSTGPEVDLPTRDLPGGGTDYMIDHCVTCPGYASQGVARGKNLFFGFRELTVGESDAATFMNSDGSGSFQNIFAKVSGENPSEIYGQLRSEIPEADLYLMNPNGVLFGESSSLDVKGSFHVSTAHGINFDNGEAFEASLGGGIPSIEANPVSFGFLLEAGQPQGITFAQTKDFGVGPGKTLSAVAGEVHVAGRFQGEIFTSIQSSGGVIQLAAVAPGATVPMDFTELEIGGFDPDEALVRITDDALVQVDGASSQGQGRIVIRGGSFQMAPSANFVTSPALRVFEGGAGEQAAIDIEVAGEAKLDNAEILSVMRGTAGSGDVSLVADSISLDNESLVKGVIDSNPAGLAGPSLRLEAGTSVEIRGLSKVQTHDDAGLGFNRGKVGGISVLAKEVTLSGSRPESAQQNASASEISTVSSGSGDAGTIRVDASEGTVSLEEGARIVSERAQGVFASGTPSDLGAIEVFADTLNVSGGAQILSASAAGIGGGAIRIGTPEAPVGNVEIHDASIVSETTSAGRGGDVWIHARGRLGVHDGYIASQTISSGPGGDLEVHAGEILIENTEAPSAEDITAQIAALTSRSSESAGGDGPGGDVTIRAGSLTLLNGGQLRTVTDGSAPGGDVDVVVDGTLLAEGEIALPDEEGNPGQGESIASGVFARSALYAPKPDPGNGGGGPAPPTIPTTGAAGRIDIVARDLTLRSGGLISARAEGTGADQSQGGAGDLHIIAETVSVEGSPDASSEISTRGAGGPGGNLTIDAEQVRLRSGGIVSASATGAGDSGDLIINALDIEMEGRESGIYAQSLGVTFGVGKAGNLTLAPPQGERLTLAVRDGAQISVESRTSEAGTIVIKNADLVEVSDGGRITAIVGDVPTQTDASPSDISIVDAAEVVLRNGTITAETSGNAEGGTVFVEAATVELADGSEITASSTGGSGAGDAGSIVIAATDSFEASSSRVTTTAEEAAGGRISIQAGRLVYLLDAEVRTEVKGDSDIGNAGDIDIPLRGNEGVGADPTVPDFVVINRSTIIANAQLGNAGNITITGQDVLISEGTVIEASSQKGGINGIIEVTTPDGDVVGQVTPLPADFSDPSDRLLPPCIARTERTGSFVVQKSEAPPPAPDGPLSPALGNAVTEPALRETMECPMPEEST